jgi:hypothetical protein
VAASLNGRDNEIGIGHSLSGTFKKRAHNHLAQGSGRAMMTSLITGRRGLLMCGSFLLVITSGSAPAAVDNPMLLPPHPGLRQIMKARSSTPFGKRYDTLAPVIDQTFGLTATLRESVGPAT